MFWCGKYESCAWHLIVAIKTITTMTFCLEYVTVDIIHYQRHQFLKKEHHTPRSEALRRCHRFHIGEIGRAAASSSSVATASGGLYTSLTRGGTFFFRCRGDRAGVFAVFLTVLAVCVEPPWLMSVVARERRRVAEKGLFSKKITQRSIPPVEKITKMVRVNLRGEWQNHKWYVWKLVNFWRRYVQILCSRTNLKGIWGLKLVEIRSCVIFVTKKI